MNREKEEPLNFDDSPLFFSMTPSVQEENETFGEGINVRILQREDPYCWSRMKEMEVSMKYNNKFRLIDGVLYRHWKNKSGTSLCVVIPLVLVPKIIKECHDGDRGVHPGQFRTINLIREKYWWCTLKKDVIDYVQKCDHCTLKKKAKFAKPEFQPVVDSFDMTEGPRPFAQICIDFKDLSHRETVQEKQVYCRGLLLHHQVCHRWCASGHQDENCSGLVRQPCHL